VSESRPDDYEQQVHDGCDSEAAAAFQRWLALDEMLANREDWHFEPASDPSGPVWCFGLMSECRLALAAEPEWFRGDVHATDTPKHLYDEEHVAMWLAEHEEQYRGLSPLGRTSSSSSSTTSHLNRL